MPDAEVAYDHAWHRLYIKDGVTGRLVRNRDVAAAARALGELLADPIERRRLGEAARAHMQKEFAYERMVDVMNEGFIKAMGMTDNAAKTGIVWPKSGIQLE